ncbi:serine protease [Pseudonocardia spinosispora]|uniref:serine protease n=1 Tax=Pseudonocardia spinosispora TaxID=103441 RepID=UPI0004268D0B|nr:serine protease [Pseudonocardia spinosispora]
METVDRVVAERGVAGLAATACVRVKDVTGEVVGSAFLVGPDLVATCAHVVADATMADPYAAAAPDVEIAVDFPVLPGGPAARSARVHRWVPIAEDGTGDVALLRLDEPAPPGAVMPPVRRVEGLWDHRFRAFGFPEGRADGVWTTGLIRSAQGTGWFQLQGTLGDQPVEGGFSGSPVWDDETGAVVGMTVAADRDPSVTTAYLIPIEHVLGLDPELLPSPYRGLEPFGEEHAEYFFGRDTDLRRLRDAVERCPLVAVSGPSGAGKSSLVKAGLLPTLRAEGTRIAQVRPRPGAPLLMDVAAAVLELADPGSAEARRARDAERIGTALAEPTTTEAARAELTEALIGTDAGRVVLVVDQFEELAESTPDLARDLLTVLAGLGERLRVVLTVRGVAMDEILTPSVAEALGSGTVLVGPMDRTQLREAIVRPAERAPGLAFDDGLVERILDDAGTEPGQLPLVESLLAQLWARREGGSLTTRGYEAAGGVAGALSVHAEHVVTSAFGADTEQLRLLCTRLAVPGREGRFVRRPVRYTDLPEELRELVPPLAAGRLVVVAGGHGSAGTVELAHQSLIDHWARLRDWLAADRDFLTWRAELDADLHRWESSNRDDGVLRRGAALSSGEQWVGSRGQELTVDEHAYLRASRDRARRDVRRRRTVLAGLGVVVLVAAVLTVVAVRGQARNTRQQSLVDSENLARAASERAVSNPVVAAQLALAAWRAGPTNPAARTALGNEYLAFDSTESVITTSTDPTPMRISAHGSSENGYVYLTHDTPRVDVVVDPTGPQPRQAAVAVPDTRVDQRVGNDGAHYYSVSADGAVWETDVRSEARAARLAEPTGAQRKLAGTSPDSTRVGWWEKVTDTRVALTVFDLGTRAARQVFLDLPDVASILLTSDPDQVLVRQGDAGLPGSRISVRTVSSNTELRQLPATPEIVNEGRDILSCAPGDPRTGGARSVVTVSDLLSGVPQRQIPLNPYSACTGYTVASGGRYLVEQYLHGMSAAQDAWRATDLTTGSSYTFTTPPLDKKDVTELPLQIGVVPGVEGPPTAFVVVGPSLIRVRTQPQLPVDTGGTPPRRIVLADGGVVLTLSQPGNDMSTFDATSGSPLGTWKNPDPGNSQMYLADEPWVVRREDAHWFLNRYRIPGLDGAAPIALPAGAVHGRGVDLTFTADVQGRTGMVVALIGGVLSGWDAATGKQVGQAVPLSAPGSDWYAGHAAVWPRRGHPEQVIVQTADDRIQIWDVGAARMVEELPVPVALGGAAQLGDLVVADGDRLVALTRASRLEAWDLATGRRTADVAVPQAIGLAGVSADGQLVSETLTAGGVSIGLYDLRSLAPAGTLNPGTLGAVSIRNGGVVLSGEAGYPPSAMPATATTWRDHLCHTLPARYTQDTLAQLPAGFDTSSPCTL